MEYVTYDYEDNAACGYWHIYSLDQEPAGVEFGAASLLSMGIITLTKQSFGTPMLGRNRPARKAGHRRQVGAVCPAGSSPDPHPFGPSFERELELEVELRDWEASFDAEQEQREAF